MRYVWVTWDDVEAWTLSLAEKILSSGFRPDAIVAIARGGLCPARILADALDVNLVFSFKVEHWGSTATRTRNEAVVLQRLTEDVKGKKVLLVDDIVDTGKSLKVGKEHALEIGAVEVKTAAMQWIANAEFTPDFYGVKVEEWAWFIYPWNRVEDLTNIARREGVKKDLGSFFKGRLGVEVPERYLRFVEGRL